MKKFTKNNMNTQLKNRIEGGDSLVIMTKNPFSKIEDGMDQPKG